MEETNRNGYTAGAMFDSDAQATGGVGEVGAGRAPLEDFLGQAEELLKRTANMTDEDVQRLREQVASSLAEARAQLSRATSSADAFVRERPWAALGIAAGAAVLIGWLLRGRSRD